MATPSIAEIATRWVSDGTAMELVNWQRRALGIRHAIAEEAFAGLPYHSHPQSLHVWLPLPEQWRAEDFVETAAADGVTIAPTHSFVVGRRPMPHAVRLCIGSPPSVEALQIACERLERLLGSQPKSSFET